MGSRVHTYVDFTEVLETSCFEEELRRHSVEKPKIYCHLKIFREIILQ